MEYFLLNLSYSMQGWRDIIAENAGFDRRLDPVRKLVAELGGSFANFHFYDREPFPRDRPVTVMDKFALFGATDLIAVLAMPTKESAHAFTILLRTFSHIRDVRLTALMPFEHAINDSVATAAKVIARGEFTGPKPAANSRQ